MLTGCAGFTGGAPPLRIRQANGHPIDAEGRFVLYWITAARRSRASFGLDRAIAWSVELGRPLVVLETLRVDDPFTSDRLHRFVLDGMADNGQAFAATSVLYYAYVEPSPGARRGLLERLAADAAVVVTDEFPCSVVPAAVAATARRISVRVETVDGNGLIPLAATPRAYPGAVHHRRFMQQFLREHLRDVPASTPAFAALPPRLAALPPDVVTRWPPATERLLAGDASALAALPIDHSVPCVSIAGGSSAARRTLTSFVRNRLRTYDMNHNHPDVHGTSGLSPYMHFGHISSHEVFAAVMRREQWTLGKLGTRATGRRHGWWGTSAGAEAFLDQLVVWREMAFATCAQRPDDYDRFESLPGWAQETLAEHADDPRPFLYTRVQFEQAATHDPLWNAAQLEMVRGGWMHNYMRMLWGKKILEWSASPRDALETMMALMNRWSLDGCDPNSYAGYMWTLGKYDRPWPERPIYGTVRAMSSSTLMKKVRVKQYLARAQSPLSD